MIAAESHWCDVPDLDFGLIGDGLVVCLVCGRRWRRFQLPESERLVWSMRPQEFGPWRTYGERFVHVRTGEIVEGPPPAPPAGESWALIRRHPWSPATGGDRKARKGERRRGSDPTAFSRARGSSPND
jgi:hypothetical protein